MPITVATCHCESCKAAARQFEEEGAGPVIGADGSIDYVLFRKDRVRLVRGRKHLADRHLEAGSPTRRVIATCCQTPMFLDFAPGHWLSLYRSGFGKQAPAPAMRTYTAKFFLKLIGSRAAMGLRRPKVAF